MVFRRLFSYVLSITIAYTAHAQRSAFQAIDIKTFLFSDNYYIGDDNWAYLSGKNYQPLPYQISNLAFESLPKSGGFPGFKKGWGFRADLLRTLFSIKGEHNHRVDWGIGVGYRSYTEKQNRPPINYFADTLRVYQVNTLTRRYTQQYADIQTKVVYHMMDPNGGVGLYIGFALQASLAFSGRAQEDFTASEAFYNPSLRVWMQTGKMAQFQDIPAKRISYFSWGIPLGIYIKLSKHLALLPELSYWHNTNRKYMYPDNYGGKKKNSSMGWYLSMGVRYEF